MQGYFPLIRSLKIKTRLKRSVKRIEGEQKFRSGRWISCSRRWSLHPRILMNTCSCTFSISIVQSPRYSFSTDVIVKLRLWGNFNVVSFRRISSTGIIRSRGYALKMHASKRTLLKMRKRTTQEKDSSLQNDIKRLYQSKKCERRQCAIKNIE